MTARTFRICGYSKQQNAELYCSNAKGIVYSIAPERHGELCRASSSLAENQQADARCEQYAIHCPEFLPE